jgi:nucleotide-binding universal stress UspA family protein
MTFRILVPLDGSLLAERAIPWADRLADALHGEIELVRVVEPGDVSDGASETTYYQSMENESWSSEVALRLESERFDRVPPARTTVLQGTAGEVIAAHAQVIGANLIVMATHGRTGVQRTLLGSVAATVVRESGVPVLVIPPEGRLQAEPRARRVLVPMDGSELSEAVLTYVAPLAKALDWTLVLFWVASWPPQAIPIQGALIPIGFLEHSDVNMTDYLDHRARELKAEGIKTDVRYYFGDRRRSIVAFAEEAGIDLIAMSTHGRNSLGRLVLGSVAEYVLSHATLPVLAVRPSQVPPDTNIVDQLLDQAAQKQGPPVPVILSARQANLARIALEHLAWAAGRHHGIREEAGDVIDLLDAASTPGRSSISGGVANGDAIHAP